MKRTKLADRVLPGYTRNEEIANMATHIAGAVFGIAALVFCVLKAAGRHDAYRVTGAAIYGASMITLYTVSSIYHGLRPCMGKKVMQVMDHCTIYFLIGGTYTPIVLGPIREMNPALGWTIFGLVWGISAAAAVFTAIDHNKFRKLSMLCYILAGWVIAGASVPTIRAISLQGFLFLLAGGVAYSIGAVLYALGKKKQTRYVHTVFHVFVLIGTVLQFITVCFFCL
jgi:hemolysin III